MRFGKRSDSENGENIKRMASNGKWMRFGKRFSGSPFDGSYDA
jgi:hypothetical protein